MCFPWTTVTFLTFTKRFSITSQVASRLSALNYTQPNKDACPNSKHQHDPVLPKRHSRNTLPSHISKGVFPSAYPKKAAHYQNPPL